MTLADTFGTIHTSRARRSGRRSAQSPIRNLSAAHYHRYHHSRPIRRLLHMPTRTLRACTICGRPSHGPRCPAHQHNIKRNQRLRASIAATATICPNCQQATTPTNPMTADHLTPQAHGGQDTPTNLRPLCRRCNSTRGAGQQDGHTPTAPHPAKFSREKVD